GRKSPTPPLSARAGITRHIAKVAPPNTPDTDPPAHPRPRDLRARAPSGCARRASVLEAASRAYSAPPVRAPAVA
ncbi:hypothetical protein, partial [Rhodococcus sp. IEGM 1307]|uniref:hypothetical protein n=1 Tax=Rhodococcus sp. IEGM 1307 TaxID=3047091 RepID=UPI0024B79BD5